MLRALNGLAWAIAVTAIVAGIKLGARAAAGADSYGYISEADLWLQGRPWILQPFVDRIPWSDRWTFTPLGYKPAPERWSVAPPVAHPPVDRGAIVPSYSAGLPLLMAVAKAVAGQCAIFWIVPLFGGVLILATYALGARAGSPAAGLAGAWLTATSPTFVVSLLAPMSDIPAAAAWAVAWWCLLGRTVASAVGAGAALALAIVVRPNLAPLTAAVAIYLALRVRRVEAPDRRRQIRRGVVVAAGVAVGVLITSAINWVLYGSPLSSGYGPLRDQFHAANVMPNVANYGRWFVEEHTIVPLIGAIVAIVLAALRRLPQTIDRDAVVAAAVFTAGLWANYVFYLIFESSSYLRFVLPSWPFVMIGAALAAQAVVGAFHGRAATVAAAIAIVGGASLGARGVYRAAGAGAFDQRESESRYILAGKWVRLLTPPNSVVMAMQHSGSLRYYGGRVTMRYDTVDRDVLDRRIQWFSDRGIRTFAVLDDWEVDVFKARFGRQGNGLANALVRLPNIRVFDLNESATTQGGWSTVPAASEPLCVPPQPQPTLRLTPQ